MEASEKSIGVHGDGGREEQAAGAGGPAERDHERAGVAQNVRTVHPRCQHESYLVPRIWNENKQALQSIHYSEMLMCTLI